MIDEVLGAEKIVKHGVPLGLFHSQLGKSFASTLVNKKNIDKNLKNLFIISLVVMPFLAIFNINMPLLIFIVELDFSWPSFNSGLTGWRSDFTVAGTANEFHTDFPPCISATVNYNNGQFSQ